MTALDMTTQRVLEVIVRNPNGTLEEVVLKCPNLTWNQIFLVIDQLSRNGIISVIPNAPGIYTIHHSNTPETAEQHHVVA